MIIEWAGFIWPVYQANALPTIDVGSLAAQTMDPTDWRGFLWLVLAALAGALAALSFKQFQPMTRRERVIFVFVGFVFAIFVGPLIVGTILPDEKASSRIVGALYFLIAAGSNWLLPWAIERFTGVKPEKRQ